MPQTAAALLETARSTHLVALGGGRVIDTAKAIAAINGSAVAAIPTTLSGAEMTGIHRLPAGAEDRAAGLVRPRLVIADPEAMTTATERQLRASAMNALAHGADSLYTPYSNPVSEWAALRGAGLIASSLDEPRDTRDRAALAEGAILCGYAIDSGLFSIHHVVCQTLVRVCGSPHAETNAAILPRAMAFMEPRAPDAIESLARAIESAPGRDRGPDPPARRRPAGPRRGRRRPRPARRGPRRDAAAPRAGLQPAAADQGRARRDDRARLVGRGQVGGPGSCRSWTTEITSISAPSPTSAYLPPRNGKRVLMPIRKRTLAR